MSKTRSPRESCSITIGITDIESSPTEDTKAARTQRATPEPAAALTAQGELNFVPAAASEHSGRPRTRPVTASSAVAFTHHQPRQERTPRPLGLGTPSGAQEVTWACRHDNHSETPKLLPQVWGQRALAG